MSAAAHRSAAVPTLHSVAEYEEWVSATWSDGHASALVLQFGSAACPRCPAFGDALAALCASHRVSRAYCNAHDEDDLVEHFNILSLPAFVLVHKMKDTERESSPLVVGSATPCQLRDAVVAVARPVLQLDADF